jgi:hypothetical protein
MAVDLANLGTALLVALLLCAGLKPGRMLQDANTANQQWRMAQNLAEWQRKTAAGVPGWPGPAD